MPSFGAKLSNWTRNSLEKRDKWINVGISASRELEPLTTAGNWENKRKLHAPVGLDYHETLLFYGLLWASIQKCFIMLI